VLLPYAAYLRVYEPLSAFPEPDRSVWARYADAADRPRRVVALEAEHAAAIRRLAARPQVLAPARESTDAYVRRTTDMTFVCPWQTRLRSWVAFSAFRAALPPWPAGAFAPRTVADQVEADFERWKRRGDTLRSYVLSSTWQVPFVWFIPFGATERCLVLSASSEPATGGPRGGAAGSTPSRTGTSNGRSSARPATVGGPTTAVPTRTLIYVTSMAQARRRLAGAGTALRIAAGDAGDAGDYGVGAGAVGALGRWLEGFHPDALVELDYGGLVRLMSDAALRADESVAEVAAMLAGMVRDPVMARAMYERLRGRWRFVQALSAAN
jgi:hypothetical protein